MTERRPPKRADKPFSQGDKKPFRGGGGFGSGPSRVSGGRPDRGTRPGTTGKKPFAPSGMPRRDGSKKSDPTPSLARKVALDIVSDVLHNDSFAALSLDEQLSRVNMKQLDRRFCASIVYRTLENLIRIDYVLSFYLQDAEHLEPKVRDILRVSVCQILFHDRVPDNAVVDEAVKLTRSLGYEGLTGVTNAVLRAVIRGRDEIKWPSPDEGARYLSILFSVPQWLAQRLLDAYGPETARDICAYRNESHYTVVRPNLTRFTDGQFEQLLEKKVWEAEKGHAAHAWRVRMASEIARDSDYTGGNFSIQGESSIMAAQAVGAKPGMQILDLCAAPGGKTAYLAETMNGSGRVYAWDVHEHRVALIRAMAKRLRLDNVRPVQRDATVFRDDLAGQMDAVLIDAPCSGLGVMDNKPDIKLRATEESVKTLTETQEKLLDTGCRYVRRGGTLVYSTCSILPEENGEQVRIFLQKHPEFTIDPLPNEIGARFREQAGEYGLQLLPHRDDVEGFFIARMRKVK